MTDVCCHVPVVKKAKEKERTTWKNVQHDARFRRIKAFFKKHNCPAEKYAADFVLAADRNNLDWRLLPSISFLESSGGKNYRNNNMFGWANADQPFPSIRASIWHIAERLANAPVYKGKSLEQKIYHYNQRPIYKLTLKRVMRRIELQESAI